MTGQLRVALVQEASTLDADHNREWLSELTPPDTDLVVFPEAFQRDFGDPGGDLAPYAETSDGAFGSEVAAVATARETTIVAGMFEPSPDLARPFNTLLVRGAVDASYRKIHLYDSFGYRESDRLSAGPLEPVTFELAGFTIGLMTCYDLRFPELARSLVDAGADVLVVPAAWVAGDHKVDHWRTLVHARAIENTVYVAAVGQPAPRYCGHSMIVGPFGEVVAEAGPDADIVRGVLDVSVIAEARRTNPSLANRRR
ncbi:carbon-nitrogen hydrolase family protein [Nocardioides sp. InS609-2]|uniref:carbon-nitrogen hydrolase family protein n=1 Tax=Nocardioides sp. InS609-2 TaxID=2760705 RepID=UPI0020BE92EA|nr:carbon-nitrogen hydrolase family protein [Nocardioides sp. InS609-2]